MREGRLRVRVDLRVHGSFLSVMSNCLIFLCLP